MSMQYPKLDKKLVKVLCEAGFEAIKSYFSIIVEIQYPLARQEAKEFIAANTSVTQSQQSDKTSHKTVEGTQFKLSSLKQMQWMTLRQQIKPDYQAWYKTQRQQLDDKIWWKTLSAKIKDSEQIHLAWKTQEKYKYYRSRSISFVYNTVLPVFTQWLKMAKAELKVNAHKINSQVKSDYKKFLKAIENFIEEHKKALRASMLERLTAASDQHDLRFDDVTVATLYKLEKVGAIKETEKPKFPQHGMTPDAFYNFVTILQQEGTREERRALKDLPYFKNTQAVTYQTFVVAFRKKLITLHYLVPTACVDFMPKRPPFYLKLPRFLHGLFAGVKLRYEFFQHDTAQYLLAAHTTIEKLAIPESIMLADLRPLPLLHEAHYFETLIDQEQKRQEENLKNLSGILYQKERAMLMNYHQYLKKVGATLMFKKVDLLEIILRQYEKRDTNLSKQEKLNLHELLDEIKADQKKWGLHFKFLHLEGECYMKLLVDKQVPPLTPKANNQIHAQTVLTKKVEKSLPEKFEAEIFKNPLALTLDALQLHSQALQAAFTTLTISHKSLMAVNTLNRKIYHYIYQFVNALCAMGSKESWLANAEKITLMLALLKTLSADNSALQDVVTNLEKAHTEIQVFDWEVILDFKLNPEKKALETFLNKRQSLPITEAELAFHNVQKVTEEKLFNDVVNYPDENQAKTFSITNQL